jgi:hypothetical protein
MPFANTDMTQVMGIGNYVGEIREGPDGHLYEWVEGVDGLGNPIGFWKKAFKAVKGVAKGALKVVGSVLIPPPLKRVARQVCNFLPQVGPVVSQIPDARQPYAMANRFCGVLRRAGIAGPEDGMMEVPEQVMATLPDLSRTVPAPVRSIAKTACGVVNKLSPLARFVPPVRPYASGATTLCSILKKTGIAGAEGELMEAPDGQLYEVVEGIGAAGERKRYLRRVWLSIPAVIRTRSGRGVARRAAKVPAAVAPAATAVAPAATAARRVRRAR